MATILIVDDDKELVESTKAILEDKGHAVISAHDGKTGMEKARAKKPDLMILDVMMAHDREGFEVAQEIRKDPITKGIPVILVTGIRKAKGLPFSYEPDEDWLPVKAVLDKPVRAEQLLASVKAALKG